MERIAFITGGGGYLGRATVAALAKHGWRVRLLVRNADDSHDPFVETFIGDVRDDPSVLADHMRGCHAVLHLAAAKSDEPWSDDVNVLGTQNVVRAAEAAGVKKMVYVSTQSARLIRPGTYGRTKLQGERVVRAGNVPWTILRPSLVYDETGAGVFRTLQRLASLPFVPVFGPGTALFRPVHVDDAAACIASAIDRAEHGSTIDVGGPDELTFDALVDAVLRQAGKKRPIVHVPRWAGYVLAALPKSPITYSNVRGGIERHAMNILPMRLVLGVEARAFERDTAFEKLLLQYVFRSVLPGWEPDAATIDRCRTAMRIHDVPVLLLPPIWMMSSMDIATRILFPHGDFQRSLRVAAAIAECQPDGANTLLPARMSPLLAIFSVGLLCARSGLAMIGGIALMLLLPFTVRRYGA